jgi:hypothetical protein
MHRGVDLRSAETVTRYYGTRALLRNNREHSDKARVASHRFSAPMRAENSNTHLIAADKLIAPGGGAKTQMHGDPGQSSRSAMHQRDNPVAMSAVARTANTGVPPPCANPGPRAPCHSMTAAGPSHEAPTTHDADIAAGSNLGAMYAAEEGSGGVCDGTIACSANAALNKQVRTEIPRSLAQQWIDDFLYGEDAVEISQVWRLSLVRAVRSRGRPQSKSVEQAFSEPGSLHSRSVLLEFALCTSFRHPSVL